MEVGSQLIVRCVNKKGARLRTYRTWACGDGCCSGRDEDGDEPYKFGDEVTIDPEVHTYDGGENLDGFALDSDDWEILEIPAGYAVSESLGIYELEYRPEKGKEDHYEV